MCTISVLVNACEAPVVIAANRDELYARASRPPERLGAGIAGGVDAVGGGTWLALRRDGAFAAVTNQAGAIAPASARSRGLVVRELVAARDPDAYVAALDPRHYASMNLMWGDAAGVRVGYLRSSGEREVVRLPDGIHVLCNDRLECPFVRGTRLRERIAAQLARDRSVAALVAALPAWLGDHTVVASPFDLPSATPLHGVAARTGEASPFDANCIHTPVYGTRCSTIAVIAPGRVTTYLHADGTPCTTPFVDHLELLS
jgi:uncharacterized protein with NRDE domain